VASTASIGRTARRHRVAAVIVETLAACAGAVLILLAWLCDRDWLDRHVLPHMFLTRFEQTLWWVIERGLLAALGLALVFVVRPWLGRAIRQGRGRALAIDGGLALLAVLASGLTSELILRNIHWRKVDLWAAGEEPLRQADAHRGWRNVPSRTGVATFDDRRIEYRIDAMGRRYGRRPVDPARPAILYTGESIMFGFRLNWPETIAGRIEDLTGVQSANLAVNGYSTDQAYMPLAAQLPRFARPVAVVSIFVPSLLERNLDDDRPHIDSDLAWHPARPFWKLERLAKEVFPYRNPARIDGAIAMTREVLSATVEAARARHAVPLILVPCFMPEQPSERAIRYRVLDAASLPYVLVPIDPHWHLPGDRHPDARANQVMARAVIAGLLLRQPGLFQSNGSDSRAIGR